MATRIMNVNKEKEFIAKVTPPLKDHELKGATSVLERIKLADDSGDFRTRDHLLSQVVEASDSGVFDKKDGDQ